MKDLSVLQEPPFTDQGSIQVLVYKNKCTKLSSGASLNPQLSGEVHTPVGPQTFMGFVGHHNHPERRELHKGIQYLALCRQRECVSFRGKRKGRK